jgi:hypothetical protein
MKTIRLALSLSILFAFIATSHTFGQDYLINIKGDTIKGDLRLLMAGTEKRVQVISPDKKKTNYPIFQVRRFRLDDEMYEPVKGQSGYTFMKLMKSGYLSLYAFQMSNQPAFDGLLLQKKDGAQLEVPNLNFKKMMKKFLDDCPQVTDSIEAHWGKRELDKIIDAYNGCIDQRTNNLRQTVAAKQGQNDLTAAWDSLQEKINSKADFEGKSDALEMILDVKGKIQRGEKVPKFLIEGLRSSLSATDLMPELDQAISQLEKP